MDRLIDFFKEGIWKVRLTGITGSRYFFIRALRTFLLARRGFLADNCPLNASALTFYSLMSIVPLFAVVIGIAKGFGLDNVLLRESMIPGGWQSDVAGLVLKFVDAYLRRVRGGLLAGIGVAALLVTVVSMLGNIERSLNTIWGIQIPRSIFRKLADYLSLLLVGTVLLVISSSLTIVIASKARMVTGVLSPLSSLAVKAVPYVIVWCLFTFVYVVMPNARVRLVPALAGGIVAGTVYQLVQWVYIKFQVGVASYGPVYGSFAALPLFLVWLQISWMVLLFGAEISCASVNVDTFGFSPDYSRLSPSFSRLLQLRVLQAIIRRFADGKEAPTARMVSGELEIPLKLVDTFLRSLVAAGLISEVRTNNDAGPAYQPGCDIEKFTLYFVLESLEKNGIGYGDVEEITGARKIHACLESFGLLIKDSPANVHLRDL